MEDSALPIGNDKQGIQTIIWIWSINNHINFLHNFSDNLATEQLVDLVEQIMN